MPQLDPESVALSTELQARRENNITLLESRCKLARTTHNQVTIAKNGLKLDSIEPLLSILDFGHFEVGVLREIKDTPILLRRF